MGINKAICFIALFLFTLAMAFVGFCYIEKVQIENQRENMNLKLEIQKVSEKLQEVDVNQRAFECHVNNIIYDKY